MCRCALLWRLCDGDFTPVRGRGGEGGGEGMGRDESRGPVLGAPLAVGGGGQGIRRA